MRTTTKANSRHRGSSVHRLASLPVVARSRQRGPLRRQPLHRQSAKHLEPAIKSGFRVPARLRPFSISTIPSRRRRRACTARSTCWGSPNACVRASCRRRRAKCTAIRKFTLSLSATGPRQPDRAASMLRRRQALRGDAICRLLPPACTADQGCADLQYVWTQHASKRRSGRVEFHHPGTEQPAHYDFRRRNANAVVAMSRI